MPTLARIENLKIQMFADDHNPPHFHLVTPDHEALVQISDFQVLAGSIDRRDYEAAIAWAAENGNVLEDTWKRLNER